MEEEKKESVNIKEEQSSDVEKIEESRKGLTLKDQINLAFQQADGNWAKFSMLDKEKMERMQKEMWRAVEEERKQANQMRKRRAQVDAFVNPLEWLRYREINAKYWNLVADVLEEHELEKILKMENRKKRRFDRMYRKCLKD